MSPFSFPSKPFLLISTGLLSFDGNCGDLGGESVGEFCKVAITYVGTICVMCDIENLQYHLQTPSFASASQVKLFLLGLLTMATEYATMMKACGTFVPF